MKLIDKDAVVAQIERRIKTNKECMLGLRNLDYYQGKVDALNDINSFLDTLEVKEIDLDKHINKYFKRWYVDETDQGNILHSPDGQAGLISVKKVAKHFFELGLNASNPLTWKDMAEIVKIANLLEIEWLNSTPWDGIRDCGFYAEVLKRFKAQKGE